MTKILVVDDEQAIRRALALNLTARGFVTIEAASGEHGLTAAASEHPDLVLLDLGLPGMDGVTVLEALRGWTAVPIIVLTAREDERSKVRALEAGADDYVTKPFGMAELVARIRAVLRRMHHEAQDPVIATADFRIDLPDHRVILVPSGEEVRLTPTEFAIVAHLAKHRDRLVTYPQLMAAVWGPTATSDPNVLRVHMTHIRRKLEPDRDRPRYFLTEAGVGYRFQSGG